MTHQQSPTIAVVSGISKKFGEHLALDDVSLELKAGEVLSILGPNGAGKTTLINTLLGRLSVQSGEINILGFRPGRIPLKRLCGAMLQVANLPETLTVREHIELFQSYYPKPMTYQDVIEYAGLSKIQSQLSKNLSGGQRQRLQFALAICGNPRLLFLDEPSVGMDIEARQSLWAAIKGLRKRGTSIVLTSHYLEEADFLSDRIIMINQGKIIQQGTPETIKASVNLKKIRFKGNVTIEQLLKINGVERATSQGLYFELQTNDPVICLKHLFEISDELQELTVSGAALEDAFVQLNRQSEL